MARTKLETLPDRDLNKLTKKELQKILPAALKKTYREMEKLEENGVVYDYNRTFRREVGEEYQDAIAGMKGSTRNELLQLAAYTKTHLASEYSSLAGVAKKEMRALQMIGQAVKGGDKPPSIKRVKGRQYQMLGMTFTRDDIELIMKVYGELYKNNQIYISKFGYAEVFYQINTVVFDMGIKDPKEAMAMTLTILEEYNTQVEMEWTMQEEELEDEFEEIRNRTKERKKFRNE